MRAVLLEHHANARCRAGARGSCVPPDSMKGVTPKHNDVALPWRHSRFLEWRFHTRKVSNQKKNFTRNSLAQHWALPVWWRRAVLPSLPWVVSFLSFFYTGHGTGAHWH